MIDWFVSKRVERWHKNKKTKKLLHEYLKLTIDEYGIWLVSNQLPKFYFLRYIKIKFFLKK